MRRSIPRARDSSQARKKIRFTEEKTAAGGVDHLFSVLPGAAHSLCQESRSYRIFAPAGEEADRDLRLAVDETVAHEIPVEILNRYDIPVLEISAEKSDLVVIDPQTARFDGAAFPFFQNGCRVCRQIFLTVYIVVICVKR